MSTIGVVEHRDHNGHAICACLTTNFLEPVSDLSRWGGKTLHTILFIQGKCEDTLCRIAELVRNDGSGSLLGDCERRAALAAMHRPPVTPLHSVIAKATRIVILEDLVDHSNVGAIFRSAAGLGVDAILGTPRCANPLDRY